MTERRGEGQRIGEKKQDEGRRKERRGEIQVWREDRFEWRRKEKNGEGQN